MAATRIPTLVFIAALASAPLMAEGIPASYAEDRGNAEFVMATGYEPVLDPSLISDTASMNACLGLFEGLMQYDPITNKAVPALAESWTTSEDGLVVTFKLRKAAWSDGHPVTAEDFVYAMKRILDPETGADLGYLPAMVLEGGRDFNDGKAPFDGVGIRAVDHRTLEYRLKAPAPYFVEMTCNSAFWPLPSWAVDKYGTRWTRSNNIVTNGPYLLSEWVRGSHLLLERNPGYWDAAAVRLERVRIITGGDAAAVLAAYARGDIDWVSGIPADPPEAVMLRPDYQSADRLATTYYVFNVMRQPFDDIRVRRALAASVDKKALVDTFFGGRQSVTDSMAPAMDGYVPQAGQGYDPDAARRLLAEAGYPGGKGFPHVELLYYPNANVEQVSAFLQAQWKENLGIDVWLRKADPREFARLRDGGHDFDIARGGWVGDYFDPNTMLDLFVTGEAYDSGLYSNPDFDARIDAAKRATGEERMAILQEAEAILMRDAPIIPLYHHINEDLIDTAVWGGWYPTPLGYHPWKYIYWKAEPTRTTVASARP